MVGEQIMSKNDQQVSKFIQQVVIFDQMVDPGRVAAGVKTVGTVRA